MTKVQEVPRDLRVALRELEGRLEREHHRREERRRVERWRRLAPDLVRPLPDVRMARLEASPKAAGRVVPRHFEFSAGGAGWRTTRASRLWPIELVGAERLWKPPQSIGSAETRKAAAFLRLSLEVHPAAPAFSQLEGFDEVTFWFRAGNRRADLVFDALALHARGAFAGVPGRDGLEPIGLDFVGMGDAETIVPHGGLPPAASLLPEWAVFPDKFAGLTIKGLGPIAARADRLIEVLVPLADASRALETNFARGDFTTNVVPVVNLVSSEIGPYAWSALDGESVVRQSNMQIFSVVSVQELGLQNATRTLEIGAAGPDGVRWEMRGVPRGEGGYDVMLSRHDPSEGPLSPATRQLRLAVLRSDGAAAATVPDRAALVSGDGLLRGELLTPASGPHLPTLRGEPPKFSMQTPSTLTESLLSRTFLDSTVPEVVANAEASRRAEVSRTITALQLVESRPVALELALRDGEALAPCLGNRMVLNLDEGVFPGGLGRFVLMLDRYLGSMTPTGRFTQLVFQTTGGVVHTCPPRFGIRDDL